MQDDVLERFLLLSGRFDLCTNMAGKFSLSKKKKKIYINIGEPGFMTYTASSHQVAAKETFWVHFWQATILSHLYIHSANPFQALCWNENIAPRLGCTHWAQLKDTDKHNFTYMHTQVNTQHLASGEESEGGIIGWCFYELCLFILDHTRLCDVPSPVISCLYHLRRMTNPVACFP